MLLDLLRSFTVGFRTDSRPIGLKNFSSLTDDECLNQLFQETSQETNPFYAVAPRKIKPRSMPLQPVVINQTYTYQSGGRYTSFMNR